MSLERSTVSSRRLAVLLAGLAVAAIAAMLAGQALSGEPGVDPPPALTTAGADPVAPFRDVENDGGTGTPAPATPTADRATDDNTASEITEEDAAAAHQVAADFAVAYASYRWDDPAEAFVERIRPLATRELIAELSRGGGGQAGQAELAARRQVVTALVESVQQQNAGSDWLDLLVVTRQDVTTSASAETRYASFLTRTVRTDEVWRVAGFQP